MFVAGLLFFVVIPGLKKRFKKQRSLILAAFAKNILSFSVQPF
jgi:hypothetical protein